MTPTDRYLKRATRGLWGQQKRDAMRELRGAVEDKIYRHRLCGLSEMEAEQAALRDLGNPAAIARELGVVHTGPQVTRMTLLLGVTGLLGFQAVAQITPVATAVLPQALRDFCTPPTDAEVRSMSTADQTRFRQVVAARGGPAGYLAACRRDIAQSGGHALLRVKDVLAALATGGIDVGDQTDYTSATSTTPLILYTGKTPGPLYDTTDIGGERYVSSGDLIAFLSFATTLPLHLNGVRNPVLEIGTVRLRLGTEDAPIKTTNVVAGVILRGGNLNLPRPTTLTYGLDGSVTPASAPRLSVPGQDGDLYAIFQNFERLKGNSSEWLMVRARTAGTVPIAFQPVTPAPRVVTTLAELNAATTRRENAVMVYRVNAADLRHVTLAQVPASQLQLVPKGQ